VDGVQSISPAGHTRLWSPEGDIAVFPNGDVAGVAEFSSGGGAKSFVFLRDATGAPKAGFGTEGFVNIDTLGYSYTPESIAVQPDGKILVGGSNGFRSYSSGTVSQQGDFAIMRLNANGSLDTTFGVGGTRVINGNRNDYGLKSIYVKPDGKILAAGTSQLFTNERYIALMQLTPNGNMDPLFGDVPNKGLNLSGYDNDAEAIVYDTAHNRIVVVSTHTVVGRNDEDIAIHQFFANGLEDNLFGGGDATVFLGDALIDDVAESVTISGGWIYVAGYRYTSNNSEEYFSEDFVARVSSGPGHSVIKSGVWDDEFGGGDGYLQVNQIGLSLLDAPEGGFYLAGETGRWEDENPQWAFGISRYNSQGTLVSTFGTQGVGRRLSIGPTINGMTSSLLSDSAGHLIFARDVDDASTNKLHVARFHEIGNLPPVVQLGGPVSYNEGDAPTILASAAKLTDTDSANLLGGNIAVRFSANAQVGDVLSIRDQGTATGKVNLSGSGLFIGTVRVGSFSGGTGGATLLIKLNANATPARVQLLLRNLQFSSVSDDPQALRRAVRVTVNDGDGGKSLAVFKLVNVVPVNDTPTIAAHGSSVTYTRRGPVARLLSSSTVLQDPDSHNFDGGVLSMAITLNGESSDILSMRT
jgi:uncharacterized delta-60 repeat protein